MYKATMFFPNGSGAVPHKFIKAISQVVEDFISTSNGKKRLERLKLPTMLQNLVR